MTDQEDRETLLKLRANVDKNPYEDIPGIILRGRSVYDDFWTMGSKRMVVHMFRLISKKNYEGIKDMFTALTEENQKVMRRDGFPKIKNVEFYKSTYNNLNYGNLGDAETISFGDKERIISLLKKEFNIVGNVTTPVEYAASLLESSTTQEDIINLWNIIFYLSNTENTKTDYMQDFIRKAEKLESFDANNKVEWKNKIDDYKKKYFGKKPEAAPAATAVPAAPVAEKKSMFSNPFAKKQEAVPVATAAPAATVPVATAAPVATEAAPAKTSMFSGFFGKKPAPAATPAAEAPVKKSFFSWGGRKTRKQNKSRKQGKSKKQRKTRK